MSPSIPNILIIESDARQTEIAMELIKEVVRANVDSTNSGERAVELASRTPYQLILADCGVGDMDGLSLLERIKRISPASGMILTSAFASIEEAVKAVRFGADDYFKKPYNPEQFKLSIRRCLDRRDLYTGDQLVTGMMLLLNACQLVSSSLEEDKILETVCGYLRREANPKGLALFRCEGESRSRVRTSSDVDPDVVEVIVEGNSFISVCRDEKAPMKLFTKSSSTPEIAVFQFKCVGNADYFVVCLAPKWGSSPDEVDSHFRLLQAQIQMTGRNVKNYRGVRHLLYLDEPTGLFNTRYMHRCLDRFFEKFNKGECGPFSVLFLDIDKFKGINDSHGHLIGTKLLQEIGHIMKRCLRKTDIAFRYGGDEFVAMLINTEINAARDIAETIRREVEKAVFLNEEGLNIHLTVSVGVAGCPDHATSKREIIEAADTAMYVVKKSSRNRVYIAEKKKAA
jgi:diguanylate cyclase (GGDEF)-like protein